MAKRGRPALPKSRIIGVYPRGKERFEIVYMENGKRKTIYRKDKESADRTRDEIENRILGLTADPSPPVTSPVAVVTGGGIVTSGDGTKADHWLKMLWDMAQKVSEKPASDEYHRAIKALSAAAQAAKQYLDIGELERALDYEIAKRDELQKSETYGTAAKVTRLHTVAQKE